MYIKVRLWAHTDSPDEHEHAQRRGDSHQTKVGAGYYKASSRSTRMSGIGVLLEGDVGLMSLLLSVSVFSAVLGRSPFLWFSFGSCIVDISIDVKLKQE